VQRGRPRDFLGADMATGSSSPSLEPMDTKERFLVRDNDAETASSVAVSVGVVEAVAAVTATSAAATATEDKISNFDMLNYGKRQVKIEYKPIKLI